MQMQPHTHTDNGRGQGAVDLVWDVIYVRCKVFHNFFLPRIHSSFLRSYVFSVFFFFSVCVCMLFFEGAMNASAEDDDDNEDAPVGEGVNAEKIRLICLKKSQEHENFY